MLSAAVVSEPVKVSQKSIVFNELRVVRGCLFGVTHCPPNPPMDGIVTSFGGVRWGFGSVRGYGELQTCCLENSRQSFDGRIATR